MDNKNKNFETQLLNISYEKPDIYSALSMPIYNSVAFEFKTAKEMEAAFCGLSDDYFYSRIENPTVKYFEERVRNITDSMSVTAVNSGMAAISNVMMSIASNGCNIITSPHLFGNTYAFLTSTLANFGVEIRFCDLTNLEQVQSLTDDKTCAVFLEIITNPQLEIADLQSLSDICHQAGVPLIADTTVIPFCSFDARSFGVDIEVVSSTKYISGGATTIGGLIIDYGIFNWKKSIPLQKWYYNFGKEAFTKRLRKEIHRNLGAYMSPQTAYMQSLGLETLKLRYERQATTCLELATKLEKLNKITSVNYTGLKDNAYYEISKKQFGDTPGAMMTIDLASRQACFDFIDKLQIIRRATNLFDNKSLAIHPSSTIFGTFPEEQRKKMDLRQETIRLSIGLESTEDLFADIEQALK
ncbi:MAG: PLP-dependent transferase [Tannerella sp.]|jgi:O-acetylhomoserine (thiol)-lyase|nr:PLP-dependent transferase [Tannerella sp.]